MNAIGCPICDAPEKATWEERVEHGCSLPGEVWRCVWCGKHHQKDPNDKSEPMNYGMHGWCAGCEEKHKAANPDCDWFRGFEPIGDTLPGGPLDGVWEDSGFTLSPRES
jgi:hypothetical protein